MDLCGWPVITSTSTRCAPICSGRRIGCWAIPGAVWPISRRSPGEQVWAPQEAPTPEFTKRCRGRHYPAARKSESNQERTMLWVDPFDGVAAGLDRGGPGATGTISVGMTIQRSPQPDSTAASVPQNHLDGLAGAQGGHGVGDPLQGHIGARACRSPAYLEAPHCLCLSQTVASLSKRA